MFPLFESCGILANFALFASSWSNHFWFRVAFVHTRTQVDTPWLDGAHVVFGKVTSGLDVVDKIEAVGSQSGRTSKTVIIKDCGEL